MNENRLLLVGISILVFLVLGATPVYSHEPGLSVIIRRVQYPPRIDGRLDDTAWKSASKIELAWTDTDERTNRDIQTHVMAIYDEENLYVAFLSRDSHPENLRSKVSEHDKGVTTDDCVAISVEPGNTGQGPMFNVTVNPANVTRDGWIPPKALIEKRRKGEIPPELVPVAFAYPMGIDWEPKSLKTATQVDKDFWTVEVKIPFEDLLLPRPLVGQTWGGNFMRHALGWGDLWMTWSKAGRGFFSASEKFGDLIFE